MSQASLFRFLNIWAFLFFLLLTLASSLSFKISHIDQKDANKQIEVAGDAYITDQGLQLTPYDRNRALNGKAGRARYVEPFHLWDNATGNLADFTTHFTFNIDSDGNASYADGLAFFLANFTTPFNQTIPGGAGLGLLDPTLITTSEPVVAVAFDTYSNQKDIPMTNVSINVKSMRVPAISKPWLNNITQGKDNNASITYNATTKILQVFFTEFSNGHYHTGSLSYEVDLKDYLPEFVSIGFSAATGMFFEKNTVSSWEFDSTLLISSGSANNFSVSPATQNHTISNLVNPEGKSKKKGIETAGFSIAVLTFLAVMSLGIYKCFKKIKTAKRDDNQNTRGRAMDDTHQSTLVREMDGVFQKAGTGAKRFSYSELATATNSFSEEQKLGEGGFGGVYLGFLRDLNLEVAVKRVSSQSKQGIEEYASEVKIISRLRHRNLVQLHGWCHEKGELLLVYEYMPGGSLDSHLFKRNSPLNWRLRYRIAQGLASALSYLHEEWEQCVLHRDIKSSNVLLDSSFNARLGDFGLASLVDHEKAPEKTYSGGTPGYVAPECHFTFKTSKESDVFSFGIVALEIACGRKAILYNVPDGEKNLVDWVWDLYGMGKVLEAADPKLCQDFEKQEMERLMVIGLWCAHPDKNSRPNITQVVHCLKFKVQLPILPPKMPKPVYSTSSSVVSFSDSYSYGTQAVESQEFEYHTNSTGNTGFTSSSVSVVSSTSA